MRIAVFSIAFLWIGLTSAPGAGPTSKIVEIGVIGTVAIIAASVLIMLSKGDFKRQKQPGTSTHHN
ncbi:hypothetical protein [Aeromicrobium duanguangcaii]|uniref:hypothetical protein n=1 Tax=Aeromicrobium duanguangcaii TaxID=2968086 RepID=UPI002017EF60|nr:hypothetical protein [Aeromicrobium duanguangcaii]MCL3838371.1 hypothetical protein [Aeromicrobium duanguangcaii]